MTYSEIARDYLLREGLPPDQVIKTGSPMREVIDHYKAGIEASKVLERLDCGTALLRGQFASRRECRFAGQPAATVRHAEWAGRTLRRAGVVSTHPRTRNRLNALGLTTHPFGWRCSSRSAFSTTSSCRLTRALRLSDSGTITEESSILNFPALNLREVHERPEGFEEAAVMLVGLDLERTLDCLSVLESQPRGAERALRIVSDYEPTNVSEKVLRIILSYTDFVNRRVWKK